MRVFRRLIYVWINRDHELKLLERGIEAVEVIAVQQRMRPSKPDQPREEPEQIGVGVEGAPGIEAVLVGVPRMDVMLNLNAAFTFLYLAKTVKGRGFSEVEDSPDWHGKPFPPDMAERAIAAGVKADRCDIYTDVDGVYTTDPRIVPEARRRGVAEALVRDFPDDDGPTRGTRHSSGATTFIA